MSALRCGGPLLSLELRTDVYRHEFQRNAAGEIDPTSRFSRIDHMTTKFLRHSSTPADLQMTPAQNQRLAPLVENLVRIARLQLENTNARALEEAFQPLRNEVHQQQRVMLHYVNLDLMSLFVVRNSENPSGVNILRTVPVGLFAFVDELTSLSMHCGLLRAIPDWVGRFSLLTDLWLDGDTFFVMPLQTKNKVLPEYIDGVRPLRYDQPKTNGTLLALPEAIGNLGTLLKLTLINMDQITALPASIAKLTNLQSLLIANCPKLLLLPDLGPMPALRQLRLAGGLAFDLPDRVGQWKLQKLHLCDEQDLSDDEDDHVPAQLLKDLSPTLEDLLIGSCVMTQMNNMPLMPKLRALRIATSIDNYVNSETLFHVTADKMPNLEKVSGVCGFSSQMHTLTALESLQMFLDGDFGTPVTSAMPSLVQLEMTGNDYVECENIPAWIHGDTFPNLKTLHILKLFGVRMMPAAIASFTRLSVLHLVNLKDGHYDTPHRVRMIIHPEIFQMPNLKELNLINCDVMSLPEFSLPSLVFLRISHCRNLRELPGLTGAGLPKLSILQLHSLRCRSLPHTLGELTSLLGLYISKCDLAGIPLSLGRLTNLKQLVIHQDLATDVPGSACPIMADVAHCLPNMRFLQKLCLRGPDTRTTQECDDDVVVIGLALKAWPLPFLNLKDVNFPIMGYCQLSCTRQNVQGAMRETEARINKMSYSEFKHTLPPPPAPFNFKKFVLRLGLPDAAKNWNDGQIIRHWYLMHTKIFAFASGQHSRLGEGSAILNTSPILVGMIADMVTGWHKTVVRDSHRAVQREKEEHLMKIELAQSLQNDEDVLQTEYERYMSTCRQEADFLRAEELARVNRAQKQAQLLAQASALEQTIALENAVARDQRRQNKLASEVERSRAQARIQSVVRGAAAGAGSSGGGGAASSGGL